LATIGDAIMSNQTQRLDKTYMLNSNSYRVLPLAFRALLLLSVIHALVALVVALLLFPSASGLVSTFLISFGLLSVFDRILLENKEAIWERKEDPRRVNSRTAISILAIFLGVFICYFMVVFCAPKEFSLQYLSKQLESVAGSLKADRFDKLGVILINNITVLYILFFLSLCYRAGAIFVIVWNASVWGATFGFLAHDPNIDSIVGTVVQQLKLAVSILPHLITEASAYILASMSALFLAKAVGKYSLKSQQFNQVLRACLLLLLTSTAMVFVAAVIEFNYASFAVGYFFHD
jgi:uncharacterized membrane protein SpoIIM required for sporulation